MTINKIRITYLVDIVGDTLKKHNLQINETKTEHTTILRGNRLEETWRQTKKLGSLLGDEEDLLRRKQLSTGAMRSLNKLWLSKRKVQINKKIKLYKSLVKTALVYNNNTWGLTRNQKDVLNRFHRQQLRKIWNNPYMKNRDVYKKSDESILTIDIAKQRWELFGHCLRMPQNTPAQQAMTYYFDITKNTKKCSGRQRITIASVLHDDILKTNNKFPLKSLLTKGDLNVARRIAKDR